MKLETLAKKYRAKIPTYRSTAYNILAAMASGKKVSMLDGVKHFDTVALSQRISDLRCKYGWHGVIRDKFVTQRNGRRHKEYWI